MAGKLRVATRLDSRGPQHLYEEFCRSWINWAGPPKTIICDPDSGYQGAFAEEVGRAQIQLN
eukprot:13663595-Alexandrium_andersonii.AAC.1